MTHVRNDRTSRQRRRARGTLMLAAASGGLLAATLAGSPTARADNPFTDIVNDVQNSITIGEADYSAAATDFSTASGTNAGLAAEFLGFDNTFMSPVDYTLLGLTAAGTGMDFSGFHSLFEVQSGLFPLTAAGEQAQAAFDLANASGYFTEVSSALSGGEYFLAVEEILLGSFFDVVGGQSDTLAALFSAGI